MSLTWMAWTWPTAAFFLFILAALIGMSIWERLDPGGGPRTGILMLDTTRGSPVYLIARQRLHPPGLAGAGGHTLVGAVIISIIYAVAVFRWV